ncbi:gamma-glutamyl cyclotransferase, AIG2-like domain-containing protein [Hirsutella rhossiliensis]|uniref:gamma-glutamylcyclotransferase n=1 Tax=Hirsutella rhossiliensis TaxID=111463 RepID=A0A9P8MZ76_9HYPO|nr:gamma-glutamyl cyclotransferase, AIG2-like domain-containing protein [Hirsutella rhossiliensis]KAH0963960.1 gamma-glutamyl cyclotransferase, AIG2-like domain-containing protein [Hirsutella rhossiliensis]
MAATTTAPNGPSAARKPHAGDPRPTKYYFAYGSNLHIKQMKKRCPNSRYIGRARLSNHRWQINERGYANIVEADGHRVDGLVYEIDDKDEAKLDINEGVSKNAYQKRYMPVLLHRAQGSLYRRPVSWIVDKGGPAAVCRRINKASGPATSGPPRQHWENDVLVYISLNHVEDSAPKDEYVNRLNLGIVDARALGIEDDYIRKCIRPFIPEASPNTPNQDHSSGEATRPKSATRGVKRSTPSRTGEPSPARKGQVTNRPDQQNPHRALVRMPRNTSSENVGGRAQAALATRPLTPLRSRAARRYYDAPVITVEEYIADWEWRSSI